MAIVSNMAIANHNSYNSHSDIAIIAVANIAATIAAKVHSSIATIVTYHVKYHVFIASSTLPQS